MDRMRFRFTIIRHLPKYQYGDDPYLDSLGVTSHLSPTFEIVDKEAMEWVKTVPHKRITYGPAILSLAIKFENVEDAIYFKMRWIIGTD